MFADHHAVTVQPETARCLSFAAQTADGPPSGQQMQSWLPAGEYSVVGVETVEFLTFGRVQSVPGSVRLLDGRGFTYYVAPSVIPAALYVRLRDRAPAGWTHVETSV